MFLRVLYKVIGSLITTVVYRFVDLLLLSLPSFNVGSSQYFYHKPTVWEVFPESLRVPRCLERVFLIDRSVGTVGGSLTVLSTVVVGKENYCELPRTCY